MIFLTHPLASKGSAHFLCGPARSSIALGVVEIFALAGVYICFYNSLALGKKAYDVILKWYAFGWKIGSLGISGEKRTVCRINKDRAH